MYPIQLKILEKHNFKFISPKLEANSSEELLHIMQHNEIQFNNLNIDDELKPFNAKQIKNKLIVAISRWFQDINH